MRDGGLMQFHNVMLPEGPMPYADIARRSSNRRSRGKISDGFARRGRGRSSSKAFTTPATRGARSKSVPRRSSFPITAAANSTAFRRRCRILPEVLDAVGDRTEVLFDGGIRRGSDVVKALCMGARAALIGRAYAYGLGAAGHRGVARAIEILRTDIVRTMRLLGCHDVAELDASYVDVWFP